MFSELVVGFARISAFALFPVSVLASPYTSCVNPWLKNLGVGAHKDSRQGCKAQGFRLRGFGFRIKFLGVWGVCRVRVCLPDIIAQVLIPS